MGVKMGVRGGGKEVELTFRSHTRLIVKKLDGGGGGEEEAEVKFEKKIQQTE